ncbi:UNVERIFIED_CONTAM: hypothetical protein HDU68_004365 [Siphonaria sp. JEL0065]|nr:hypothetical protein HDU68_004365 [Siphonaria sp. JEL0065]
MFSIGDGEFYVLFADGKLLASMGVVTVITSLVTLLTATSLACHIFCLAEFGGASHVAMAAALDPMASVKVLTQPKKHQNNRKVMPLLFWFILFGGAVSPFAKIGVQQLLLSTLSSERVTVYPKRNSNLTVRGETMGMSHQIPGLPLLASDKYPSASANPVRSDLLNLNTILVQPGETIAFPGKTNRTWLGYSQYDALSPGAFGLDGSLFSLQLFYMPIDFEDESYSNTTYLTLEIPQVYDPRNQTSDESNDIAYMFCTILYSIHTDSSCPTATFQLQQQFFRATTGRYKYIDLSSSHGFNRFSSERMTYSTEGSASDLNNQIIEFARSKSLEYVRTVTWRTDFSTVIRMDSKDLESSCSQNLRQALFGDRTVIRWHKPGTSIGMRFDSKAETIYDTHLYTISDPKFYGVCLGALIIILGSGITQKPARPRLTSVWVVRRKGGEIRIVLVPNVRADEEGFQSYAEARRVAKAYDAGTEMHKKATRDGYAQI